MVNEAEQNISSGERGQTIETKRHTHKETQLRKKNENNRELLHKPIQYATLYYRNWRCWLCVSMVIYHTFNVMFANAVVDQRRCLLYNRFSSIHLKWFDFDPS